MKYFLILALALGFTTSTFAEDAPVKKSPKKAYKKVPPSEPVAPPTPSPEPTPAPTTTEVTPPPATDTTTTTTTVETKNEESGERKFRVGPSVTLLGFPTPFRFGVEAKYDNLVGLSIDYGLFPSLTFSNIKVKYNSWRIGAQVYPFRGSFYLGVGIGKQNFDGSLVKDTAGTSVTYALTINTTIITPHLGWRWVSMSGFFWGMEVGAQLAASSSATFSSDAPAALQSTPEYTQNKADIEDKGKTFGQTTLPAFALVQFGWMF